MATSAQDVSMLIGLMANLGAAPIVVGGWGIDALAGTESRPHRDLDVLVQDEHVEAIVNSLVRIGFVVTTDWLPVRIELSDPESDRHVDIHPIFDDGSHGWWQHGLDDTRFEYPAASLTTGRIGTTTVRCLTPAKQRALHAGYDLRKEDLHDLDVLDRLSGSLTGVETPAPPFG